jgi:hypothetical protein
MQVDPVPDAAEQHLEPTVHEALAVHPRADARLVEQVDAHLLEDARTDAPQHILAGLSLEDDVIHPGPKEQLTEQQARRACADDGDLRSCWDVHVRSLLGATFTQSFAFILTQRIISANFRDVNLDAPRGSLRSVSLFNDSCAIVRALSHF